MINSFFSAEFNLLEIRSVDFGADLNKVGISLKFDFGGVGHISYLPKGVVEMTDTFRNFTEIKLQNTL